VSREQGVFTLEAEEYTLMKNSEKAVLIDVIGGDQVWIPKSQIIEMNERHLVISAWIAKEKELI
jgi:hypothetical protein